MASRGIQPHRVFDLGLNLLKPSESFWVLDMLKVNHVVADNVARSKYNLEIDYVVACKLVFWREK
jgi:hypothetical protein